jgi:hypothetical protein
MTLENSVANFPALPSQHPASITSFILLPAKDALVTSFVRVLWLGLFGVSGTVSSRSVPLSELDIIARFDEHLTKTWAAENVGRGSVWVARP